MSNNNIFEVADNETVESVDKKTNVLIKAGAAVTGGLCGAVLLPGLVFGVTGMAALGTLAIGVGAVGGAVGGKSVGTKLINGGNNNKQLDNKAKKAITKED